jgi:hypothetical protein
MRTLLCDPRAETLGVNILAYFQNVRDYQTRPILEKYGLDQIKPTDWIPTQVYLDVLNEMCQTPDFSSTLVAIGMGIGEMVPVPFEDARLAQVLEIWDDIYQGLHRGADVGTISVEKEEQGHYRITFTDLYPDDFSYGILYGYAKRFLPPGTQFTIYYDPRITPRDRGGEKGCTVIHAKWQ